MHFFLKTVHNTFIFSKEHTSLLRKADLFIDKNFYASDFLSLAEKYNG
jgi:DUF1365 family protein